MNTPDSLSQPEVSSDAEIVVASISGNRDAFGRIVERYQRLLCSLAYSATGSISTSEDLAQETFIEAWRQLKSLREPEKLRPWLCGILRHRIGRLRRRDDREPASKAETIDTADELAAPEESATSLTMLREEQAILWSELQRVPELYREPLILYYREHSSVEHVAAVLDLSEDAVKQRLARGRKILQERVLAFVETALARTTPGRVFTVGVLSALPAMLPAPAKAASAGTLATQGAMLAKTTSAATLVSTFTGVTSIILSLRVCFDQSRTPRERRAVAKGILCSFGGSLAFLGLIYALRAAAFRYWEQRWMLAIACQVLVLIFAATLAISTIRMMWHFRRIRSEERRNHPDCFTDFRDHIGSAAGEYRSRITFLGVPLLHIRFALADEGAPPLFGWIALGDRAYALLFAWGTLAVAPISAGVVSAGFLTVGAVSFGVISLGTVGFGLIAIGCLSMGEKAFAWLSASGWETAQSNGFALARTAAEAPIAFAQNANNAAARQIMADPHAEQSHMVSLIVIALLSLIPLVLYTRALRRRLGTKPQ